MTEKEAVAVIEKHIKRILRKKRRKKLMKSRTLVDL